MLTTVNQRKYCAESKIKLGTRRENDNGGVTTVN